jgi:hypothetical protein
MSKNLVAKNGTAIHAPATTDRNPVLCSNMRRASGYETIEAGFSVVNAPVTCLDCCRILGIEAPKTLPGAKRVKPALDTFEVGQTVTTRIGQGTIVALTASMVTYTMEGEKGTFATKRAGLRKLNG